MTHSERIQDASRMTLALNGKEKLLSEFLEKIAHDVTRQVSSLSTVDPLIELNQRIDGIIMKWPVLMSHKYGSVLRQFILKQYLTQKNQSLVQLPSLKINLLLYVEKYKRCFQAMMKHDCSHVALSDPDLMSKGQSYLKELFTLYIFTFATCKRVRFDQLFSLVISGLSSTGKTTLYEQPLLDFSHVVSSFEGVGRFKMSENVNLLMLNDCNLDVLLTSKDSQFFRNVSRSEKCVSKVFADVQSCPSVFFLVTSNHNLFSHKISGSIPVLATKTERKGTLLTSLQREANPSTVIESHFHRSKSKSFLLKYKEHIIALQNRFLELYIFSKPNLPKTFLPEPGSQFTRHHLIFGLFESVLDILLKPNSSALSNSILKTYCVRAIFLYSNDYCKHISSNVSEKLSQLKLLDQ